MESALPLLIGVSWTSADTESAAPWGKSDRSPVSRILFLLPLQDSTIISLPAEAGAHRSERRLIPEG